MHWLSDQLWTYEWFDRNEPASSFREFEPLVDLWRGKSARDLPDWRDFELMDFRDWWGWINVYDAVDGDPLSFRVRLWGSRVANLLKLDLTNRMLTMEDAASATDARHITVNDLKFARFLLDHSRIGIGYGPIDLDLGIVANYREVLLPLGPADGPADKLMFGCRPTFVQT